MQIPSVLPKRPPSAERARSMWRRREAGRTTLTAQVSHTIEARGTRRFRCFCPIHATRMRLKFCGDRSSDVLIAQYLLHAGGWSVERMLIGVRPEFFF